MIVASHMDVDGCADCLTKHYFVRDVCDFSNNKDGNDSYLKEAAMNS